MKILFHVGVGNHDRPERWWGVCVILSNLARSMEALGHECLVYCHPKAKADSIYHNYHLAEEVRYLDKLSMQPDVVFTWNGSSEGDKEIIKQYGRTKCVFGELGFFDHYETVYFDFAGTNQRSQNIVDKMDVIVDHGKFLKLRERYTKPNARNDRYAFVVMQDEKDTNITMYSPFKKMNDLLQWTCDLLNEDTDIKILYKMHPKAPCEITVTDPRVEAVTGDVHEYLEDAQLVVGCNSTALFECLLYHNRIISAGIGLNSRPIYDDEDRIRYVLHCYDKQIHQTHLADPRHIEDTWLYEQLMERYNANT